MIQVSRCANSKGHSTERFICKLTGQPCQYQRWCNLQKRWEDVQNISRCPNFKSRLQAIQEAASHKNEK